MGDAPPCAVCRKPGAYTLPDVRISDAPTWVCSATCAARLVDEREPCIVCGELVEPGEGGQAIGPIPSLHTRCARRSLDEDAPPLVVMPPTQEQLDARERTYSNMLRNPGMPTWQEATDRIKEIGERMRATMISRAEAAQRAAAPVPPTAEEAAHIRAISDGAYCNKADCRFHPGFLGGPAPAYVCPTCGRKSWNPNDGANKYCGVCGFEDGTLRKNPTR